MSSTVFDLIEPNPNPKFETQDVRKQQDEWMENHKEDVI